jgi:2,4-dienoyl-CoA reductase-like NADH-dependent reductase (Old Yellow Enzyme family)
VDIFHCSTRRFWEPEFDGSELNLAGWTRKSPASRPSPWQRRPGRRVPAVHGQHRQGGQPASLEGLLRLKADEFDLVAVGRALLVDPEWAQKVREGREADVLPFSREALTTLA